MTTKKDMQKSTRKAILALSFAAICFLPSLTNAANAARSVHLKYAPQAPLAQEAEATIKVTQCQTNSFYMAIGWDFGYCGIQHVVGIGHVVIFSVWDPGDPHDLSAKQEAVPEERRTKVLYAAPEMTVSRFEFEGTGAKAMAGLDWKIGEEVSFRVESFKDGEDRMAFTCFIKMKDTPWTKLATFSTLCHGDKVKGVTNVYSFVEDFWRNGESAKRVRRAEFSGIRTRSKDGEWVNVRVACFTGDTTQTKNIDAGMTDSGAFFLQTGGDTKNEHTPLWSFVEL
ncbi:MAG: DUF3472 domain-containing protein [Kiritimatiellae bacterium]|nr:DUF3472 domain-containing protein [Kiritimatiellia bacterium]